MSPLQTRLSTIKDPTDTRAVVLRIDDFFKEPTNAQLIRRILNHADCTIEPAER